MLTRYARIHERKLNINLTPKGNFHPNTPSRSLVGVGAGSFLKSERGGIASVQTIVILKPEEDNIRRAERHQKSKLFHA